MPYAAAPVRDNGTHTASLALAGFAGATISLQTFVNGRLSVAIGSSLLAATVNNIGALASAAGVGFATGAIPRAARRWRALREAGSAPGGEGGGAPGAGDGGAPGAGDGGAPRLWHVLCGALGAVYICVVTAAAPEIGIALVTVAAVCGQSIGSLALDRLGLGPVGRLPLSARRVGGVALAIAAVVAGADLSGQLGLETALLAASVLAGIALAAQQVGLGHVAMRTGEPIAAAALTIAMSSIVIFGVTGAVGGAGALGGEGGVDFWAAAPLLYCGGIVGALVAASVAKAVQALGAVVLVLALVAGQSAGALAIDLVAPVEGQHVTLMRVLSVLLVLAAVGIGAAAGAAAPQRTAAESVNRP
jgi:bacterial/archaeal transporter family-2 protein